MIFLLLVYIALSSNYFLVRSSSLIGETIENSFSYCSFLLYKLLGAVGVGSGHFFLPYLTCFCIDPGGEILLFLDGDLLLLFLLWDLCLIVLDTLK